MAAAAAAGRVEQLWVEESVRERAEVSAVVEAAAASGGTVEFVHDVGRMAVTASPQGVIARCAKIVPVTLEELVDLAEPPAVMVVDRVVDPHNLGAIVRSGVAAGIEGVVVSDRRAAPLDATAFKAAAGALEVARVAVVGSIAEAVSALQRLGLWGVGLDPAAERSLFGLDLLAEGCALVVGGEVGLSRLVRDRLDLTVRIPTSPKVDSLNASVAAALAAFELRRTRSFLSAK